MLDIFHFCNPDVEQVIDFLANCVVALDDKQLEKFSVYKIDISVLKKAFEEARVIKILGKDENGEEITNSIKVQYR